MSQEVEIRFAVQPDDLSRLKNARALKEITAGRPSSSRLSSVYYDTEGLGFAKAGLSLRVRKIGRAYVQTVKSETTGALASERGEYECKLPSPEPKLDSIPNLQIRERLLAIANDAPLAALFETSIRRTTRSLTTPAGEKIEFALDRGEIRTLANGHATVPVSEVELELKEGSLGSLFDIARRLSREAPLTVSTESKAERGLRALEGRDVESHKAGRTELTPDCTAEEAFRVTLNHCLRHIARNTGALVEARDPEGVHQMRVGLRRLRAALSAFGAAFRVPALEELRERAKTLGNIFGETRELDVFALELLAPVEEASKHPGLPQLKLALEELRRESWERSIELVRSDDFTGFLIDLAAAVEARVWRDSASQEQFSEFLRPAHELGCEALDIAFKKASKRAKHLSKLNIEERHRLRIALKKLRYAAEFFAPLFPAKAVAVFLARLSKLQDLFGSLNDAATTELILRRITEHAGPRAGVELSEAAAFVDGWHQSRVPPTWEKAKKRWKRFIRTKAFWSN